MPDPLDALTSDPLNAITSGTSDPTTSDPTDAGPADQANYCGNGGDDTDGCSGAPDPDPPADPPPATDDSANQADQARGALSQPLAQILDPIIEPPVQIFYQYGATAYTRTWMVDVMRRVGQRNGPYPPDAKPGLSPNGWDNGCHPVCFTMVLRWWCDVFDTTKTKVVFPLTYPATKTALDPVEMCQRFTGTPYFDSYLPDGVIKAVYGPSDWSVNHDKIAIYAQQLSFEGVNMTFTAYPCANSTADAAKKQKLKDMLALGPVMVNISSPGHYVVVTGYRDNVIYICDPGFVIRRYAGQKPFVINYPQDRQLSAGDDCAGHPGYVTVKDAWLQMVIRLESITFPSAIGEGENGAFFEDHTGDS